MKIVFDSGVLISFSETCFINLFNRLHENLGEFIITESVKYESIDRAKNIMNQNIKETTQQIDEILRSRNITWEQILRDYQKNILKGDIWQDVKGIWSKKKIDPVEYQRVVRDRKSVV